MPREDDDVAPRPAAPGSRTLIQAGGFLLAAAATLVVLLTDNAQLLKVAVVAVAWAFVLATFAAGRRGTDRLTAAVRERELRRGYELELEREVAARHEYELELENELRRETEDAMRYELDALRAEIASLAGLRDEVARVSALRDDIADLGELRHDLADLTALREELARVAALGDDVKALYSLRQELGQLAELRADMGRLRVELTEQLSSEMLVERIIMRTQAGRLPADAARLEANGRTLDVAGEWADDVPPRELTGGWPAVRLDEPRPTQQFEQVRVERPDLRPPVPAPPPVPTSTFAAVSPVEPDRWSALTDPSFTAAARWPEQEPPSRHSAGEVAPQTAAVPAPPPVARPVPYRRDAPPVQPPPAASAPQTRMTLRPEVPPPAELRPEIPPYRRRHEGGATEDQPGAGYRVVAPTEPPPPLSEPTTQGTRVAEILAENGGPPPSGGRRRRRYRDDDEQDDVLARVLGR
jgi:hypothetical protein